MYAVEFQAPIINNTITIPSHYCQKLNNNHNVKIILLASDNIEDVSENEQNYYQDLLLNMSDDDKQISSQTTINL